MGGGSVARSVSLDSAPESSASARSPDQSPSKTLDESGSQDAFPEAKEEEVSYEEDPARRDCEDERVEIEETSSNLDEYEDAGHEANEVTKEDEDDDAEEVEEEEEDDAGVDDDDAGDVGDKGLTEEHAADDAQIARVADVDATEEPDQESVDKADEGVVEGDDHVDFTVEDNAAAAAAAADDDDVLKREDFGPHGDVEDYDDDARQEPPTEEEKRVAADDEKTTPTRIKTPEPSSVFRSFFTSDVSIEKLEAEIEASKKARMEEDLKNPSAEPASSAVPDCVTPTVPEDPAETFGRSSIDRRDSETSASEASFKADSAEPAPDAAKPKEKKRFSLADYKKRRQTEGVPVSSEARAEDREGPGTPTLDEELATLAAPPTLNTLPLFEKLEKLEKAQKESKKKGKQLLFLFFCDVAEVN
jgi:hypothetical protein